MLPIEPSQPKAPKVFISYSHDSREHEDHVLTLADRLRKDGIDALIDQYMPPPPDGWPIWMDTEIQKADFVLVVCTDVYLRRVERREQPGKGRGVLWEAKLIYNHLYQTDWPVQKFIPILLTAFDLSHIPAPLRGMTWYSVDTVDSYEGLYRHLTGQPRLSMPELGKLKALPPRQPQSYPASLIVRSEDQLLTGQDRRNRLAVLTRVRQDWIEGVLNQSLYKVARIELKLEAGADAVVRHSVNTVIQILDQSPTGLPAGTTVTNVFDEQGEALLILGGPGTGKTTLLLELAQDLLARAERDPNYPIPVVFNLSSWALRRQPLAHWLVAELNEQSDVPKTLAQRWVEREMILPLLDGLDEVEALHRHACVEAINDFRRDHGLLPIAVCSRAVDYDALGTKLRLRSAVVVQPLTRDQIMDCLERAGTQFEPLRTAINEDASLEECLAIPLLLWVAILSHWKTRTEAGGDDSFAHRRHQLFESFVGAMFKRKGVTGRYTRDHTCKWLNRLACVMNRNKQTIFYLENLNLDWLPTRAQRWLCQAGIIGVSGVALSLITGLIGALIAALIGVLMFKQGTKAIELSDWQFWQFLLSYGVIGLYVGLLGGLPFGLVFGLIGSFAELGPVARLHLRLGDMRGRLRGAVRSGLIFGLLAGLGVWLGAGLIIALLIYMLTRLRIGLGVPSGVPLSKALGSALRLELRLLLSVGLVGGLIAALIRLLTGEVVSMRRSRPNQGTRNSIRNAFASCLIFGLAGVLITGWTGDAFVGPCVGLIFWQVGGGMFAMRHYVVRLALWMGGSAPLRYARFLDFAADRLFLHKVGGGYIFVHRFLLEHFASLPRRA